jgi:hypothetical protein
LSVNLFLTATEGGVALEVETHEGSKWYVISIPRYLNQIELRTGCHKHIVSGSRVCGDILNMEITGLSGAFYC